MQVINEPPEALEYRFYPDCFDTHSLRPYTAEQFIAACGNLNELSSPQIAKLYAHVKAQLDAMGEAYDTLSKFVELMKNVKVPEAFERDELSSFTLEDGTRVTKSSRTTCTILDKSRGYQWLKDNGLEDLVTETVNAQTMGSTAKSILANVSEPIYNEKNEVVGFTQVEGPSDLPPDLFDVKVTATTSVTKGKAKKK